MKRWDPQTMHDIGLSLFKKIAKKKQRAHHNHDIHFLAREIDDWLPRAINTLCDGSYNPMHSQRYYFKDGVVEQLLIPDRIIQHVLLKQLKPTFSSVFNPNCFHTHGPNGVKLATAHVRRALQEDNPQYVIRADIKGFYSSICQHTLIKDVNQHYEDPKVRAMLERIITNPIDTPRGCCNPDKGIALRGPLSQFFSALYLKPLDDAFDQMDVTYARFQDDIVILCKSKRQFNRCRRRMMNILQERKLKLSRKKSRFSSISTGFHFLGIDYPGTQTPDNTRVTQVSKAAIAECTEGQFLLEMGGGRQPS